MNRNGFSLLETLIAVAILSVAVIAVLRVGAQGQEAMLGSRAVTTLTTLAASKWAEIEAAGPDKWKGQQGYFEPPNGDYLWEVRISTLDDIEAARKVVLTVHSQRDARQSLKLEGYFVIPGEFTPPKG